MEYQGTYQVHRRMHIRPLTTVIRIVQEMYRQHPGLEIQIIDRDEDRVFTGRSLVALLTLGGFRPGDMVGILARGEYLLEQLKGYADRVGEIFSTVSDEESLGDMLARESKPED